MTHPEKRAGALLSALRDDLPTAVDQARIRQKLASAGVAIGTAATTTHLAQAAMASGAKVATTSSVPSAAMLGGTSTALAGKATAITTWASLATGTKLALVSVAVAGGAYPAMSHWTTRPSTAPVAPSPAIAAARADASEIRAANSPRVDGAASPAQAPASELAEPPTDLPLAARSAMQSAKGAPASAMGAGTATARSVSPKNPAAVGHYNKLAVRSRVDQGLREETLLIEQALVAARTDDKIAAARWLEEHERRFPSGVLVSERQRLQSTLR